MDALHAVLAIMLVSTVGIAPSSCTTMGGGTSDGGMTGSGDGGGCWPHYSCPRRSAAFPAIR